MSQDNTPFADIRARLASLRSRLATYSDAWPSDQAFAGSDTTDTVHLVVNASGDPEGLTLDARWLTRIGVRGLARAVNEAKNAALTGLVPTWFERIGPDLQLSDSGVVVADAAPRRFAPYPHEASTSFGEVEAKFDQLQRDRSEQELDRERDLQLDDRRRFLSPLGWFTIVQSGESLLLIEADDEDFQFRPVDEVADELLASLKQLRVNYTNLIGSAGTDGQ